MNEEIKEKAIHYAREDKPYDFLGLFFNVTPKGIDGNDLHLTTWTKNAETFFVVVHKRNWIEEFKDVVDHWKETKIDTPHQIKELNDDYKDFYDWLVSISDLIDEGLKKPTENNADIFVVMFDKGHYKKIDLENMTDKEKYDTAKRDNKHCRIYTAREYENILNSFEPLEKYVWTYIIRLEGGEPPMYSNEYNE